MDTDFSTNQSLSNIHQPDSDTVDEIPGVEVNRQNASARSGSDVEDLDSFNPIEPPPLDWRSESSTEVDSDDDMYDPGFPPSVDDLDKVIREESLVAHLDMSDPVAQLNINQQELVQNEEKELKDRENDIETDKNGGEGIENLEVVVANQEEEPFRELEGSVTEEEFPNRTSADEDHSHIHNLLGQLQLMREEPQSCCQTLPLHHSPGPSEVEACAAVLTTADGSSETTGLLFSESHHRDLLGLLQCTEIGATPHLTCLPPGGEVDAVVSVSYSQEDAQRYWGNHENGRHQRHRDDSLASLPDEEYPEPVWMKLGEEPPDEEAVGESEQVGHNRGNHKNCKI